MTPQLQQAIKLLQLSRLELIDTIQQELEENPALDEDLNAPEEQQPGQDNTQSPEPEEKKELSEEEKIQNDIDWNNYIDEYNSPGRINFEAEGKETPKYEAFISKKESLDDHLLWQLLMTAPSDETERIGSLIVGNLNKNGYLDLSVEDLSKLSGSSVESVENVLSLMQTFDPLGICARDLKECLMIQARHFGIDDTIIIEIINNHLKNLENKNYKAICRALKMNIDEVALAINVIKGLEPRPGRQISDEEPHYIVPDIYVYKMEDSFVIVLNEEGISRLRINSYYKNAVNRGELISDTAKEYLQEKLRSASWLIKSIHQRQKTIFKVMESIVKFQNDFFEKGIAYLKPMVLRDVAEDIGMHESTISRVTTNKYAHTPQGIFELKYFFNSSISRIHGEALASASVQEKIKRIIENEDPKKPYSDSKIANLLKDANINIARRTVAKYRELLRVLPSNKRKQI